MLRIEADDAVTTGGVLRHQGVPFTGEVVETKPDGTVLTLHTYLDGVEDGPYREWFDTGTPRAEGEVRRGVPVGRHRRWHPDGRLAAERVFSDTGDERARREWDGNGDPVG